ncbi:MAG TPA: ATP-dependent DNA helicase [Candidatus Paceibacterota bacterium]
MKSVAFDTAYKSFNSKQKEAVDTIEGPVMVIAGPGTGKTTVLTLRIAQILRKTDIPPDAILALTFTESGVRSMRKKLVEIIGPEAYRVAIHTFHGLANEIIKTYPDKFPRIIGSEHIEDLEHIQLVDELLAKGHFKVLRPKGDPIYYVRKIIDTIQNLKKDAITPDSLHRLVTEEEKNIASAPDVRHASGKYAGEIKGSYRERLGAVAKNKELVRAYRLYEKALAEKRLYDYEDMIIEVVQRLKEDRDLRLRLQEEYHYILADEHQDANKSQNAFLESLASFHEEPNLFVVGDEKQAIFRFQGASLENFLYFKSRFPGTRLIVLTENYRSHQTILDAAHSLIIHNEVADESLRAELRAASGQVPQRVTVVHAPDRLSEISFVADAIKGLLKDGRVALQEIALLVRDNVHAGPIEQELESRGIPIARFADTNALDHPYLEALLAFIRAAVHPTDDALVAKAIFGAFLHIDPVAIARTFSFRSRGTSILDALKTAKETEPFTELLTRCARIAHSEPLVEAFETIVGQTQFLDFVVTHPYSSELLPRYAGLLQTIIRHAERDKKATLADFIERLDTAGKHGHAIAVSYTPQTGVQLLTAHGSKGLEFDYVYILHANDNFWGGRRAHQAFKLPVIGTLPNDSIDDERRLFYVAMTRARKSVTISFYEQGEDGKEKSPSRFISEIAVAHIEQREVPQISPVSRVLYAGKKKREAGMEKKYLNGLFLERGFSVTHLNNFLECPWRYFYVDLLRIPRRQDNAALYGTAMHDALKHYFDAYAREEEITINRAAALFENYVYRTHMSDYDLKRYVQEGKKEIKAYLSHTKFSRSILNEYKIVGVPFTVADSTITLTGKLDKVERLPEGGINVVDYKTGNPRSRNEIMGRTASSNGDYYRQLVFYKLLLSLYKEGEWKMKTGTIEFIKPDGKGKFHREAFEIEDSEIADLKSVIARVAGEILSLSFWDKSCNDKECEWCHLRKISA